MAIVYLGKYFYTKCVQFIFLIVIVSSRKYRRPDFCNDKGNTDSSFLWEVKGDPPSYFFGTIHVPYTRVWNYVPDNAKRAFQMSDSVFFELDLTDPYTISALTSCQLLPKGENLSNILPGDLFKRLKDHLSYVRSQMTSWVTHDQRGRGLYADYLFNAITGNWERKRPVWVMLMVNSLTKGDIRSRGVPVLDLFLAQEAERQKKQTGAIERVEEQCVPLNTLNYTQGVFALDHTLSQQENLRQGRGRPTHSTDSLIALYNCGSLDAVVLAQDSTQASSLSVPQLGNQSLPPVEAETAQRIDNYFRRELILKRNERMGKRVVRILKSNPNQSFFFAFGAGHFLGNFSVLDVVRESGFEIDHLSPDHKIKRKRRRGSKGGGFVPKMSILKNFSLPSKDLRPDDQIDPAFARFLSEHKRDFFGTMNRGEGEPDITPTPRKPFNDLWVRIDNPEFKESLGVYNRNEEYLDNQEKKEVEESLRVWYGLPTSGISPKKENKMTILLLLMILFINIFL
ncbi:UNVERIFIED_CONTAM: hypothetical protein RMT77_011695 [Armadillidium vulgare]